MSNIKLIFSILFLISCSSRTIEFKSIQTLSENESIVFGQLKLLFTGEEMQFIRVPGFKFNIYIYDEETDNYIEYPLYGDGSFFWKLKPGHYVITTCSGATSGTPFTQYNIGAKFFVPNDKAIIYIGTISIQYKSNKYSKSIEDEYEIDVEKLEKKYPLITKMKKKIIKQVMEWE